MDIRNFFGVQSVNKKSGQKSVPKPELKSKLEKQESKTNKRQRKDSKEEKRPSRKTPVKEEKKPSKKPPIKEEKKKVDDAVISIDDDDEDDDFNADENGNSFDKSKTKEKKKKENGKNIGTKKHKISRSSDEEMEVDEVRSKKTKGGKRSQRIIDSDTEEDPTPKKKDKKSKGKRGSVSFIEDSDEESSKPRKTTLDAFMKTPSPGKAKAAVKKQPSPDKGTPVSMMDFFGSSSVQRSDKKRVVSKRKLEEEEAVEIHDDDDFEMTLKQLDDAHKPSKKARVEEEMASKKPDTTSPEKEKISLARKLAAKAKTDVSPKKTSHDKSQVFVPDTPISKKSPGKKSPSKMEFTPKKTSPGISEKAATPKTSPGQASGAKTLNTKKSPVKQSPPKTEKSPDTPSLDKKVSYRSYLTREGPQSLGSKEVPEGAENCLEGLTFVITGVLESFERDETKHFIEKYGGKVTGSVSKKTSYLVAGRDSGESKLNKARGFGTKIINEDELLNLIRTKPGKKSKYEIQAEESIKKEKQQKAKKVEEKPVKIEKLSEFERKPSDSTASSSSPMKSDKAENMTLMWVDKYKPTTLKQVIGQQGDKSNAKKLFNWLTSWHKNRAANIKPQGKFFGKDDTGAGFKAALLSGPPGIGKTTTATLVCKEAGFSFVELNASDTRSKKSLQGEVAEALNNETIDDFFGAKKSTTHGLKHCLVMDEVDGMAGNEDRGGMQELVQLIKTTKIPIVCMCNDRNSPKMRTLSNYCFDLRFQRPRLEQIKAAMMSIAFKEGLKVPPPALNEMIQAANQDIRQVIHNLSMWTASEKNLTYEQAKKDSNLAKKDMKMGPFDVCRKVFVGGEETAGMSLIDKSDLFFQDYSFGPLFVQENYINVIPYGAKGNTARHLSLLARTADSLCIGDLVDRKIRSQQSWGLLPTQAIFSSVVPGEYMRGSFPQMVSFPGWLGKNSSTNKTDRILQELRTHMRLQISGDKKSLNMDYLPHLRHALTEPMVQNENEGVHDVIKLMDDYDIIKEDYDNILEISKWPNSSDPLKNLSSKTKAAFTRTYNKESHMTPYSTGAMTKKKRGRAAVEDEDDLDFEGTGEEAPAQAESEEEEDLEMDTMIKAKKKTTGKGKEPAASSSKGKGPAKGKGRGKGKGKN